MAIIGAFVVPHPPIIFPEIGHGEEFKIQKTIDAYQEVSRRIAIMQPDTLIIISPHSVMYKDYFHISPGASAKGDFAQFGYPDIRLESEYDEILALEIVKEAQANGILAGIEGELNKNLDHGTMIPLRFINEVYKRDFKIVRIGVAGLPFEEHFHLGQCIKAVADKLEKRIVVIASSDLSHCLLDSGPYEYAKEGPEYDDSIRKLLAEGDLRKVLNYSEDFCERAGECGHRSITVMAGCMDGIPLKAELLSYEGPFGVGYAVAAFQDFYVALARESLEYYLKNGEKMIIPKDTPAELLNKKAGAFVTLNKFDRLRGCIGTIQGVQDNVAEEVIENAVSAGLWDPRFRQVVENEMNDIICTVDVLSDSEPVHSLEELDVKRYGIIIAEGRRRGLLLPNLDGVDTVEEQIDITLSKAGIGKEEFQKGKCSLERFEVVRHY